MVEFDIEGDINIAASRILVPVAIATVLPNVVMPVSGTVTTTSSGGTVTVGTVPVSTILSPVAIGTVLSPIPIAGTISVGTVTAVVDIGTVNVVGTLDAILGTVNVSGTVSAISVGGGTVVVGSVLSPISIGTVQSPITATGTMVTVGTQLVEQLYRRNALLTNAVVIADGSNVNVTGSTPTGIFQDFVVDVIYGTVVVGSIITIVLGVEPQSGVPTSTIVAGDWFAGTVQTGQRLMVVGPIGEYVNVNQNVATAGTVNVGTVTGVYLTVGLSTTR